MLNFLKKNKIDYVLLFLIVIVLFLCYQNYTPNTFLSGWDTLHPEFNLKLYLERIFSVWQEHQGLGAPPSQAHAAEIPRMLIEFILILVFPLSVVRYAYLFLMAMMGTVGIYLLIKYLLSVNEKHENYVIRISAFLGALFYLLNIGTMQHFIVPLEMFVTKFGFQPFLFMYALKYLREDKKKNLVIFSIFTIFAAPMAHTATLWYVYFLSLVLFVGTFCLLNKQKSKHNVRKAIVILFLTLGLNLYWILPQLYYSFNYGLDVINSKIHRLFSDEAFYYNKKYGNFSDFLLLKNFLFDWKITTDIGKSYNLLQIWIDHFQNYFIRLIGYFFTLAGFIGYILSLKTKKKELIYFFPIVLISSFFLLSDIPLISFIFDFIRGSNPVIKETLRFPFTKFSLALILPISVSFGYINLILLKKIRPALGHTIYFYLILLTLLFYALPAFQGNFISSVVRVKIPIAYFDLFNWSNNQDKGRILTLPINTLYGWQYNKWINEENQIYQGAGFNWFGIKQPTLNREFDRWYPYNENSYKEFSYAIYSQDQGLFETLLKKYEIEYILLDKSVISQGQKEDQKVLYLPQIKTLLESSSNITLLRSFGDGIQVYQFLKTKNNLPISIQAKYAKIGPIYENNYVDFGYLENGNYISSTNDTFNPDQFYPARNILTRKDRLNKNILTVGQDHYQVNITNNFKNDQILNIPDLYNTLDEYYSDVYLQNLGSNYTLVLNKLLPHSSLTPISSQSINLDKKDMAVSINDRFFKLPVNAASGFTYLGEVLLKTRIPNSLSFYQNLDYQESSPTLSPIMPYICGEKNQGTIFGSEISKNNIQLYGKQAKICVDLPLKTMINKFDSVNAVNLQFSYQISDIVTANICVFSSITNSCLINSQLKKFIFSENQFNEFFSTFQNDIDSLSLKLQINTEGLDHLSTLKINNLTLNTVQATNSQSLDPLLPSLTFEETPSSIKGDLPQEQVLFDISKLSNNVTDCGVTKSKKLDKEVQVDESVNVLKYSSLNGDVCDTIQLPQLSRSSGYILEFESKNISGLPIKICFGAEDINTCELQDQLTQNKTYETDYFIVPPKNKGYGYTLVLHNLSIGDTPTINFLKSLKIIPFPYSYLSSIKWVSNTGSQIVNEDNYVFPHQSQFSNYLYSLNLKKNKSQLVTLNQAFEKNWAAYYVAKEISASPFLANFAPFFGRKIENHVLYNNWANGWTLDKMEIGMQQSIVIIFLPQYLEFIGFGILIIVLIFLFKTGPRSTSSKDIS